MCNTIGGDWTDIHEIINLDKSYVFKKHNIKVMTDRERKKKGRKKERKKEREKGRKKERKDERKIER